MSTPPASSAYRVAVVDDDRVSQVMLERVLSRAGYVVTIYSSGEDLLAALAASRPDVVCLDMSLPGIDGLETLRRLHASERRLPVVLFSASADQVREQALVAGATACVDKAAPWHTMLAEIERALNAL